MVVGLVVMSTTTITTLAQTGGRRPVFFDVTTYGAVADGKTDNSMVTLSLSQYNTIQSHKSNVYTYIYITLVFRSLFTNKQNQEGSVKWIKFGVSFLKSPIWIFESANHLGMSKKGFLRLGQRSVSSNLKRKATLTYQYMNLVTDYVGPIKGTLDEFFNVDVMWVQIFTDFVTCHYIGNCLTDYV